MASNGEPPKKKPPRPGPPPPPPRVATAAAVVRAAASAVLGLPLGGACGAIQPTWVSEPDTGKLVFALKGAGATIGEKAEEQRVLLNRVEAVANAIVAAGVPVVAFELARADAASAFGNVLVDRLNSRCDPKLATQF